MDNLTMDVTEAGALIGLGRSASYEAAKRGEIPTMRFGRRLRVPRAKFLEMFGVSASILENGEDQK